MSKAGRRTSVALFLSIMPRSLVDIPSIQLHTQGMELESTRNAVFSLKYHLIIVVKYRRKAFVRLVALERLREIATAVGEPGLPKFHPIVR